MDVCPPTIKTLGSNEPRKFGVCFIQRLLDLLVSTSKVPSVIEGWGERRNTKAFGEEHQEYVMGHSLASKERRHSRVFIVPQKEGKRKKEIPFHN